jgi:hypothetical protein
VLTAAKLVGETRASGASKRTQVRAHGCGRTDPGLLGTLRPPLPRPRRQPPAQPRTPSHRDRPGPPSRAGSGIPGPQTTRRQEPQGGAALPKTPPRSRSLQNPDRRGSQKEDDTPERANSDAGIDIGATDVAAERGDRRRGFEHWMATGEFRAGADWVRDASNLGWPDQQVYIGDEGNAVHGRVGRCMG